MNIMGSGMVWTSRKEAFIFALYWCICIFVRFGGSFGSRGSRTPSNSCVNQWAPCWKLDRICG